jgi:uncharacterized protein YcbK (DUF882 family)
MSDGYEYLMPDAYQLTKNFGRRELKCPCCDQCEMDPEFMKKLQELRDIMGRPMSINSGFRCASHNEAVGGSKASRHRIGLAADCSTVDWSSTDLYRLIKEAQALGFKGIGIGKTYVHLDMRDDKAKMWVY